MEDHHGVVDTSKAFKKHAFSPCHPGFGGDLIVIPWLWHGYSMLDTPLYVLQRRGAVIIAAPEALQGPFHVLQVLLRLGQHVMDHRPQLLQLPWWVHEVAERAAEGRQALAEALAAAPALVLGEEVAQAGRLDHHKHRVVA